ncbi:MAG: BON domain-containing protein [Isosphaeraceae bacterium]
MSGQRWVLRSSLGALAILVGGMSSGSAQETAGQSTQPRQAVILERPEVSVQNALRANPVTAPYPIAATWRNGVVVLSGRVGTKPVHDAAVQLAIALGFPFRDDLVIDTAETFRVAMNSTPSMTGYGALSPNLSSSYYVYPQPLFGRLDDPFFGMVPPLVSLAPWTRRPMEGPMPGPNGIGHPAPNPMQAPNRAGQPASNPGSFPGPAPSTTNHVNAPAGIGQPQNAPEDEWNPLNPPPAKGDVEITVDSAGQVFLRGVVASEEIGREIEQTARSVPGVTRVVTQFQVRPKAADMAGHDEPPPLPQPAAPGPGGDTNQVKPRRLEGPEPDAPPLMPQPEPAPAREKAPEPPRPGIVPNHAAPAQGGASALDGQRLTRRVVDSLRKRPAITDLAIMVRSTGDAVMLTGQVPTAYEDMIAYRSAQQTPGVRDIVDRLEFHVPDENHPNPLVQKGRPEDLEPYLNVQMSRHVGDLAHIDSVKAHGDHIEIRGTLQNAGDRERVLAILRSIPVLHGFRLDPTLTTD